MDSYLLAPPDHPLLVSNSRASVTTFGIALPLLSVGYHRFDHIQVSWLGREGRCMARLGAALSAHARCMAGQCVGEHALATTAAASLPDQDRRGTPPTRSFSCRSSVLAPSFAARTQCRHKRIHLRPCPLIPEPSEVTRRAAAIEVCWIAVTQNWLVLFRVIRSWIVPLGEKEISISGLLYLKTYAYDQFKCSSNHSCTRTTMEI